MQPGHPSLRLRPNKLNMTSDHPLQQHAMPTETPDDPQT
jgi:hypothetical protein